MAAVPYKWFRAMFVALAMLSAGASTVVAAEVQVDQDASVFAVITHKAGLAAKLAHNHLVVARGYEARLVFDAAEPTATTFELQAPSAQLVVDDSVEQQRWYPRIAELGILDEPFSEISDGDRKKIHKSMIGKKQLAVDKHPQIKARLVSVSEAGQGAPNGFPYVVELEVEIVGKTVKQKASGRFEADGPRVVLEAFGEMKFSDFGIAPYSAMLGAVKNDDPFHVFVRLEGESAGVESP